MTVQQTIEEKLRSGLDPSHLEVFNESHMHSVPPGSESHFKLVVVSERFADKTRVARHQMVNGLLADELRANIHALSMQTHTGAEWTRRGGRIMDSPACHGGSKTDG
jgi:BolA protein